MSSNAPPRSVWSRSAKLVRLAAGLAQKEVSSRVQGAIASSDALARVMTQVDQARQLVEALGQLKGAAMKAGQLLSMELRDVLPPEVTQVLSQLQDQGSKVGFEEIRSILEEELGAERLGQLSIEPAPIASASIGQVHRATWTRADGSTEDVVLKVQFRGIAETIDSDLALLERIARLFLAAQLKRFDLTAIFAELKGVLQRETDYLHEADALERYRAKALEVPGLAVPRVFRELCSRRVLALSYEHGLKLDRFLATAPTRDERARVTGQLLDLYFREFFDWGLVQTDANFANFLFRPERGEVVLLDFGATREYERDFIERYRRLLLATLRRDRPGALEVAVELGLIDPRESPAAKVALHELLETVLGIFSPARQPFDFTDPAVPEAAASALKAFYRELAIAPPPAQLIFLHRKLGGVYTMGRALGARVDLVPYARRLG
jgi:aarF domain-containing kinase